jgi:GNAT superfamily N-acetyltransferase
MDNWRSLVNGSGKKSEPRVILLELFRKPAGYATWIRDEEEPSKVFLLRVGVVPGKRKRGLGTLLVGQCLEYCKETHDNLEDKDPVKEIHIAIPDIHCIPDDPDNVVGFLNNSGFYPNGDIISNAKIMYGNPIDAYIFVRKIP